MKTQKLADVVVRRRLSGRPLPSNVLAARPPKVRPSAAFRALYPRRRPNRSVASLLAHARHALGALREAADLHGDCDCPLCVEAHGMLFHVALYESMLDCEALGPEKDDASRRAVRLEAAAHPDPVYRVTLALRSFHAAALKVVARHAHCPGCEICPWAEGMAYQLDVYVGLWDSTSIGRMSREAEDEEIRAMNAGRTPLLHVRRE